MTGFDEFKVIETCIFKLEERLLDDLKGEQKTQRRAMLKQEMHGGSNEGKYWSVLDGHAKEENMTLRKISKAVVGHYGVSAAVYQGWIESYLEQAENQKKLMDFREQLRKAAFKDQPELAESNLLSTREGCLEYAKKLHAKVERPKAELLVRQARNMKDGAVPRSVFAHQA